MIAQGDREPIYYKGQLYDNYFWFLRDRRLCELAGVTKDDNPWPLIPYDHFGSQFAGYQYLDMPKSALSGDVLIYRSRTLTDGDCSNLQNLVRVAWDIGMQRRRPVDAKGKRKAEDSDGMEFIKVGSPPPDFPVAKRRKTKHSRIHLGTIDLT